jgi:hypothetical protein
MQTDNQEEIRLTKEGFWDKIIHKEAPYSGTIHDFLAWIDQYKKRVEWTTLFNAGLPHYDTQGWHNPKFHDLPFGMQLGIFIQYTIEVGGRYELWEGMPRNLAEIPNQIEEWFFNEDDFYYNEKMNDKYS